MLFRVRRWGSVAYSSYRPALKAKKPNVHTVGDKCNAFGAMPLDSHKHVQEGISLAHVRLIDGAHAWVDFSAEDTIKARDRA